MKHAFTYGQNDPLLQWKIKGRLDISTLWNATLVHQGTLIIVQFSNILLFRILTTKRSRKDLPYCIVTEFVLSCILLIFRLHMQNYMDLTIISRVVVYKKLLLRIHSCNLTSTLLKQVSRHAKCNAILLYNVVTLFVFFIVSRTIY